MRMVMSSELEARAWPLGGYAPGNYTCKCLDCKVEFTGDKRAIQCLECAVTQARKVHSAVRNDAMEADNTICSLEARLEVLEALIEAQKHSDVVARTAKLLYEKDDRIEALEAKNARKDAEIDRLKRSLMGAAMFAQPAMRRAREGGNADG